MIQTPSNRQRNQKGLSLVELMIAVAIGLFLVGGIGALYLNSKNTFRVQDDLSRVQENGRFAMQILSDDIRMAGYLGCGGTASPQNNILNPNGWNQLGNAIEGYAKSAIPSGYPVAASELFGNSDIIRIQHMSADSAKLDQSSDQTGANNSTGTAQIHVDVNALGFNVNDILVISDCGHTDVFGASGISNGASAGKVNISHGSNANAQPKLSWNYRSTAEVSRLETNFYYVGTGADGQPALMRKRIGTYLSSDASQRCTNATSGIVFGLCTEELAGGVQDMRILYGVDSDGPKVGSDNITYFQAAQVSNPNNIVSVQIELLFRTTSTSLAPTAQTYTFNGATGTLAGDKGLRRVFRSTIDLRNRTL